MGDWKTPIYCFVSPAGNDKIGDWHAGLSTQEKADSDEFLKNMRKTRDWSMPNYRPRLRDYPELGELRWTSENKQHRLIGCFMKGFWCALIGCTHKQQRYNPPDALEAARRRKGQIERGEASTVGYDH
jgi:hypothetical protein